MHAENSPFTPDAFDAQSRTRLIFGVNSVEKVGRLAAELGAHTILVVTDKGIVAAGHAQRVEQLLQAEGLGVVTYGRVRENPTTRDIDDCLQVARDASIDLFIGLGGGSSMDTAKGCNFLLTNGGQMKDYWGVGKATKPMLPLIAIPTTAGTGSECQSAALIADEQTHQKMACLDPKVAARIGPMTKDGRQMPIMATDIEPTSSNPFRRAAAMQPAGMPIIRAMIMATTPSWRETGKAWAMISVTCRPSMRVDMPGSPLR